MKATIWKIGDKSKCALPHSHVKADQGSDLVIINPKLVKKLGLRMQSTSILASHRLVMSVANGDSTELKSWVKFWVKVLEIRQEMWAFVIPKNNPNVSLLLGLPWLRSVDAKLFIQKKEIHIRDIKKRETVFLIPFSITLFEDTQFNAKEKEEVNTNISSNEKNTDDSTKYSSDNELNEDSSDQDF